MTKLALAIALAASTLTISGCANTIRGAGQDASNTVNATQSAVSSTGEAIVD